MYKNRVYYVGHYRDAGYELLTRKDYIYCLVDEGGGVWRNISVSHAAQIPVSEQSISYFDGEIAVSPDGKTIAYFGIKSYVFVLRNIDGEHFFYEHTYPGRPKKGDNSLQFRGNDIFYAERWVELFIHQLKYEENFCSNPAREGLLGMAHYPV